MYTSHVYLHVYYLLCARQVVLSQVQVHAPVCKTSVLHIHTAMTSVPSHQPRYHGVPLPLQSSLLGLGTSPG